MIHLMIVLANVACFAYTGEDFISDVNRVAGFICLGMVEALIELLGFMLYVSCRR